MNTHLNDKLNIMISSNYRYSYNKHLGNMNYTA